MLNKPVAARIAEQSLKPNSNDSPQSELPKPLIDAELSDFFRQRGMKVIDKRPSGGCLWVVGTEKEIGTIIKEAEQNFSIKGTFCGGGRATGYNPGWFTKADK